MVSLPGAVEVKQVLAVVGAIRSALPQTQQDFGYTQAVTVDGDAREGAKQRGGCVLGQKSEGSTPVRLLCHLKYLLPLQTKVLPATHHPDFMWLPWRALERQCPPLTYQLRHLCSNPHALHRLNSGGGKGNWS